MTYRASNDLKSDRTASGFRPGQARSATSDLYHKGRRILRGLCAAIAVTVTLSIAMPSTANAGEDDFLGGVYLMGFNHCERGSLPADGRLLGIFDTNETPALFVLMGTQFGGNGQTTFGLPDMTNTPLPGYSPGLRWCIWTWGAYPDRQGIAPAQQLHATGITELTASRHCPRDWQDTTLGLQPRPSTGQLRRCAAGSGVVFSRGFDSRTDFTIGRLYHVLGQNCPSGMVIADGSELRIAEYSAALYPLLGTRFGGDGVNTFNLPSGPSEPGVTLCIVTNGRYPARN